MAAAVLSASFGLSGSPMADDAVESRLRELLETHDRIAAARAQLNATMERVDESWRVYYPSVNASSFAGRERRVNPDADNTTLTGREISLSVTQRVYDFGASDSTIDLAKLNEKRARLVLLDAEQQILFEGLAVYVDYTRAKKVKAFARQSVDNIKRQTELEDERVQKGAGLSTDVLQAKTQLIGAQARLVLTNGDLERSVNRHIAVYGYPPDQTVEETDVQIAPVTIPLSLEVALETARGENLLLEIAALDRDISKQVAFGAESDVYYPDLDIIGEQLWQKDVDGVQGFRGESVIRMQLSFDFDLGLTLRNTVRAATADFQSTQFLYGDVLDLTEEQVRNAWSDLETTKGNADLLEVQAIVAEEFLLLAREERKSGQRSLIDVLAGETALINAQSDAISARANVTIAQLNLLVSMGVLKLDTLHP